MHFRLLSAVLLGTRAYHRPLLLGLLYCSIHQQSIFIAGQSETLQPSHAKPEAGHHALHHSLLHTQYPVDLSGREVKRWTVRTCEESKKKNAPRYIYSFSYTTYICFCPESCFYHPIHSTVNVCCIKNDEGTRRADTNGHRNRNSQPCCGFAQQRAILRNVEKHRCSILQVQLSQRRVQKTNQKENHNLQH